PPPFWTWDFRNKAHRAASLAHVLCAVRRVRLHLSCPRAPVPGRSTPDRDTHAAKFYAAGPDDFLAGASTPDPKAQEKGSPTHCSIFRSAHVSGRQDEFLCR